HPAADRAGAAPGAGSRSRPRRQLQSARGGLTGQETAMDFSESDRVRGLRQSVREFMKNEVFPLERKLRHDGFAALLPTLKERRAKAKETGLWAAHIPTEWGGAGLSVTEFPHLSAEAGRSPLGHCMFNL